MNTNNDSLHIYQAEKVLELYQRASELACDINVAWYFDKNDHGELFKAKEQMSYVVAKLWDTYNKMQADLKKGNVG